MVRLNDDDDYDALDSIEEMMFRLTLGEKSAPIFLFLYICSTTANVGISNECSCWIYKGK